VECNPLHFKNEADLRFLFWKGMILMYPFSIGVILDSFCVPIPEAIKKAHEIGAQGLQVYATQGEMAPENMTAEKKNPSYCLPNCQVC